ncbi:hypothetical protein LTS18_008338, partial [Coniosporium uncinatum]
FGDAPVHSLAVALFLRPHEIHYFEDIGYQHGNLWVQPNNARGLQLPGFDLSYGEWAMEVDAGIGCRCEHREKSGTMNFDGLCLRKLAGAIK